MPQATYQQAGKAIDFVPTAPVAAGDVIVVGDDLVGVAKTPIDAHHLGALATEGVFNAVKDDSDLSAGDALYWDADGDPVGGTAGSGAFSGDAGAGPYAGRVLAPAGAAAGTVLMRLDQLSPSRVPDPPASGNWFLQSIGGVVEWVEDT